VKVLLADDHAIVREGLRRLLAALPGAQISEAATVDEALARVRDEQPAVIVLDLHWPGLSGLKLLRHVLAEHAEARVLVLDMCAETRCATETLRAGAAGYLSKNAPPEDLLAAVCRVAENGRYIEAEITQILGLQSIRSDPVNQLTKREADIIRLLGNGQGYAEIAAIPGVSYQTVANTCSQIKVKLGVSRIDDLVRLSANMDGV
jgi:two-component system, NarL family, invasion response regulator UvrY